MLSYIQPEDSWDDVVFLIPCFNDVQLLEQVLHTLPPEAYKLIIDDGSSTSVAQKLTVINNDKLIVIRHIINLGQGAAIETGFQYLRERWDALRASFVVTFDADGQHRIEDVRHMLKQIRQGNIDLILGSRFLALGYKHFSGGFLKYLILRYSAFISRFTIGLPLTDRHNGLRILTREAVNSIRVTQNGYGHADEILREIQRHKLRYVESQVTIDYPKFTSARGQSLLNAFNIVFRRMFGAK